MRAIVEVRIADIKSGKLPLNHKSVMFALKMFKGYIFPPIHVERLKDGKFKLCGGRHRLSAQRMLRRELVRAHVAIHEDPRPDKPLIHKPEQWGEKVIAQADGYSEQEVQRWLEE